MKSVGGRYSALSNFGLVPAAVMGLDVERLLDEAKRMLNACAPGVPAEENPGLVLGTILGLAANHGIDKLTLIASPGIYDLGAWLEQLIAESTGKEGKGIIPVDREAVGSALGIRRRSSVRVSPPRGSRRCRPRTPPSPLSRKRESPS